MEQASLDLQAASTGSNFVLSKQVKLAMEKKKGK